MGKKIRPTSSNSNNENKNNIKINPSGFLNSEYTTCEDFIIKSIPIF